MACAVAFRRPRQATPACAAQRQAPQPQALRAPAAATPAAIRRTITAASAVARPRRASVASATAANNPASVASTPYAPTPPSTPSTPPTPSAPFLSVTDIFKIGVGPSSSHTMGPMVAANRFTQVLKGLGVAAQQVSAIQVSLYGSLAFTGLGHATDRAVVLGLAGMLPEQYDVVQAEGILLAAGFAHNSGRVAAGKVAAAAQGLAAARAMTETTATITLPGLAAPVAMSVVFEFGPPLPGHANGLTIKAMDVQGQALMQETYYSIGGGFVVTADELQGGGGGASRGTMSQGAYPFPFTTAAEMLRMAEQSGLSIAQMQCANELSHRQRSTRAAAAAAGTASHTSTAECEAELDADVARIWAAMDVCMNRGLQGAGHLPGDLKVPRRAAAIYQALLSEGGAPCVNQPHTSAHTSNHTGSHDSSSSNGSSVAGGGNGSHGSSSASSSTEGSRNGNGNGTTGSNNGAAAVSVIGAAAPVGSTSGTSPPSMRRPLQAPHAVVDWICAYAMAVNEENAAGGQVVTAPTNGAAGVIPAVLRYYLDHVACQLPVPPSSSTTDSTAGLNKTQAHLAVGEFLLTAAAIGGLVKRNASISGAECGCQAEVGSAAAMAAAGLAAVMGGTPRQVENAAEIALEHHLGMTCDPVAGLVQVPCIERNGIGAVKAVSAASLALRGNGSHLVSLDVCIATMLQTGRDMSDRYKETSLGGLALNMPHVPNC